jgi:hypothetical protein
VCEEFVQVAGEVLGQIGVDFRGCGVLLVKGGRQGS